MYAWCAHDRRTYLFSLAVAVYMGKTDPAFAVMKGDHDAGRRRQVAQRTQSAATELQVRSSGFDPFAAIEE